MKKLVGLALLTTLFTTNVVFAATLQFVLQNASEFDMEITPVEIKIATDGTQEILPVIKINANTQIPYTINIADYNYVEIKEIKIINPNDKDTIINFEKNVEGTSKSAGYCSFPDTGVTAISSDSEAGKAYELMTINYVPITDEENAPLTLSCEDTGNTFVWIKD